MTNISLTAARTIIAAGQAKAMDLKLKPMAIVVLDAGGHVTAFERQDGASMLRFEIARGKAYGALCVGMGSRWLDNQALTRPHFLEGLNAVSGGNIVPVPGGVLVRDKEGTVIGAVGITGDTSDNDEICAIVGIEAAGFTAQPG